MKKTILLEESEYNDMDFRLKQYERDNEELKNIIMEL
jgi:hypothetical protein